MALPERPGPIPGGLAAPVVAAFVDAMEAHEVRLLTGLDAAALAELLALASPPRRPVLQLELAGPGDAAALIERALVQLASAVSGLWPFLWGGEDFSTMHDDALSRAHLPLRLTALAAQRPALSRAWAEKIVSCLMRKVVPRLNERSPALEWAQLTLAFAPDGLVVVAPLAASSAFVTAVEWLARHADVAILVQAATMPTSAVYDRILYGAREVVQQTISSQHDEKADIPGVPASPLVLTLPEAEGQPHPQSEVELKLYTLIQADAALRPLFAFNKFVPNLPLLQAKADVLWTSGRLVVEIDGPEHRGALKYRADRHRDYRLMLAGYRVLRLTNEDILTDAALALEKIRDVVLLVDREAR